ncbi:MAG: hypothetical protein IPM34_03805 [Saprospiraceae bacterium]|nr:hypothetical protein [Saprospiraceae bacterium]
MKHNIILSALFISLLFQFSFSQTHWQRLDNELSFIPEEIQIAANGDKYISVLGRKTILQKKQGHADWVNIMGNNPELSYMPIYNFRQLYIDHQQLPLLYYSGNHFSGIFQFAGGKFVPDSLNPGNAPLNIREELLFDSLGNYYFINNKRLEKYNTRFYSSAIVFNKNEHILKAAMVEPEINWVLTAYKPDSLRFYLLNTQNFIVQKLLQIELDNQYHDFTIVTKNGNLFVVDATGLHRYSDQGSAYQKIIIDPKLSSSLNIDAFYLTKNEQLIVGMDSLFYYSEDEGENWLPLFAFANGFPDQSTIKNIEIADSASALMHIDDGCNHYVLELEPGNSYWHKVEANYSAIQKGGLLALATGKFYASNPSCPTVESDDFAKSWSVTKILDLSILQVFAHDRNTLFAISKDGNNLMESKDEGKQWIMNLQLQQLFPGLSFMWLKSIAPSVTLLQAAIIDSSTGQVQKYIPFLNLNGTEWVSLDQAQTVFFRFQEVKYDKKNQILYAIRSMFVNPELYVSYDFGKTFILHPNFNNFSRIYSFLVNEDGHLLINGIANNQLDLYISKDLQNLESVENGKFRNMGINELYAFENNIIFGVSVVSNVFSSTDGGLTWKDISDGLGLLESDVKIIGNVSYDHNKYVYASITYDGIYQTTQSVVMTKQESKIVTPYQIIPNPVKQDFTIRNSGKNETEILKLEGLTSDGRSIFQLHPKYGQTHFSVPVDLKPGPYILQITDKNSAMHKILLLKR